jgi:hypothetical protein
MGDRRGIQSYAVSIIWQLGPFGSLTDFFDQFSLIILAIAIGILQIIEHVCTMFSPLLSHYLLFVTHCSRLHMQRIDHIIHSPASVSCSMALNDALLLDVNPGLNINTSEHCLMPTYLWRQISTRTKLYQDPDTRIPMTRTLPLTISSLTLTMDSKLRVVPLYSRVSWWIWNFTKYCLDTILHIWEMNRLYY